MSSINITSLVIETKESVIFLELKVISFDRIKLPVSITFSLARSNVKVVSISISVGRIRMVDVESASVLDTAAPVKESPSTTSVPNFSNPDKWFTLLTILSQVLSGTFVATS